MSYEPRTHSEITTAFLSILTPADSPNIVFTAALGVLHRAYCVTSAKQTKFVMQELVSAFVRDMKAGKFDIILDEKDDNNGPKN